MLQIVYFVLTAVLVGIDQLSKFWATATLKGGEIVEVIPGVFHFKYLLSGNAGISFGLLQGQFWLIIPLTTVAILLMAVLMVRSPLRRRFWFSFPCALVLAGGIGNLIDRVVYRSVVDFMDFYLIDFPTFNFADCCVVVGAIVLFAYLLFGLKGEEDTPLRTLFFGIPVKKKQEEKDDG